ncbi:MAG: hypothetical protein ABIX28_00640 [Vicinamibacterales bacterium]
MRRLTAALSLLILSACASSSVAPSTPFSREVVMAQGATASVTSGLTLTFVGVTGDSRCPADANCIQGGDALVQLQASAGGSSHEIELHTGNQQPVTAGGVTYELVRLIPYPFSSRTIDAGDYRATVRLRQGSGGPP